MVHALNASNNITDSGRGKNNYLHNNLRMSLFHTLIVFYKMFYNYIPVNCIAANLINKTETNKTNLIKTTMIDTN